MIVYIVEVFTGSSYQGDAMIFEGVFSSMEVAEEYCLKFKKEGWDYTIEPHEVDNPQ